MFASAFTKRLLECNSNGEFSLTKDFVGDDVPRYAILSHTWGADTEEVTFKDLIYGAGKSKAGYSKIRFCGEQARRDGLRYFWVDICCIQNDPPRGYHRKLLFSASYLEEPNRDLFQRFHFSLQRSLTKLPNRSDVGTVQ